MMNKKKYKRPGSMVDSYCLIAFDTVVKKIFDGGGGNRLTLHIGSLVRVKEIIDEKSVAIQIPDAEVRYGVHEHDVWKCPRDTLIHIDHSLWPYLSAVQSPVQRVSLLKQPYLCDKLASIDVEDRINVVTYDNLLVPAAVRYKGPVDSKGSGIFFGVELLDGSEGDGDGCAGGVRYFACKPGTGLFVSLDRISLPLGVMLPRLAAPPSRLPPLNSTKNGDGDNWRLEVGERVIWVSEDGPKAGVVLWTSDSPDARVCVKFDEHLGSHRENAREVTKTTVLPAYQLIKACDFFYPADVGTEKDVVERLLAAKMERGRTSNPSSSMENLINIHSPGTDSGGQPENSTFQRGESSWLGVGSLVETEVNGKLRYGIVRWIGHTNSDTQLMAGVELEDISGSGLGVETMTGDIRFIPVNELRPDPRFSEVSLQAHSSSTKSHNGFHKGYGIHGFSVGSLIEVEVSGSRHYGVVRWLGHTNSPTELMAGVELEKELDSLGDGSLGGHRYFSCPSGHALFVPVSELRFDTRFGEPSVSDIGKNSSPTSPVTNFNNSVGAPNGRCVGIPGLMAPISREDSISELCGKYRGIQGHHNSCYLDATLFSMFTFTSALDSLLLRPAGPGDLPEYTEVQRVLREEIVNPLRAELYVSSDRIMKLRHLMDRLSSVTGLTTEEKDPEEFLMSLLAQILRAEPFLKLSSGQEAYLYQLFPEKDESNDFPTVQQLFDQSFLASDIKLMQVPSCLIIQMPRFGKSYKMYPRILPSQVLDITDVIQHSPRQCTVCGKLALFECKECFNQCDAGLQSISFCERCLDTAHSHERRRGHKWRNLEVPSEIVHAALGVNVPRVYMSLSAVLCIETSHYVTFVKCGSGSDAPWCFFDSMADRKGERDGYNIPEVVACPELGNWLSERGARAIQELDEKSLPEHARRLFCDAYMCIYQSNQLSMYR